MKVRKIIDVCDGDYTEIEIEVQDKCAKCGCDILHKAHIWSKNGEICLNCYAEEMWVKENDNRRL